MKDFHSHLEFLDCITGIVRCLGLRWAWRKTSPSIIIDLFKNGSKIFLINIYLCLLFVFNKNSNSINLFDSKTFLAKPWPLPDLIGKLSQYSFSIDRTNFPIQLSAIFFPPNPLIAMRLSLNERAPLCLFWFYRFVYPLPSLFQFIHSLKGQVFLQLPLTKERKSYEQIDV